MIKLNLDIKHMRYLKCIKKLVLMDDVLMRKVFEDKGCAELLLKIILGRDDLKVVRVSTQQYVKNLQGRSVILDIYAVDSKGRHYDIEIQRADSGAVPERARFNSSMMDANLSYTGEKFTDLPEIYVIFITETDVLKGGKPIYTIDRKISELNNALFNDRSHIIYVNGECRVSTALGKLVQDLFCADPDKMNYPELAKRTRYFKEDEEGKIVMCKELKEIWEDGIAEGEAKGKAKGIEIGKRRSRLELSARLILKNKYSLEEISDITSVPVPRLKKMKIQLENRQRR